MQLSLSLSREKMSNRRGQGRGQAMVEFALALPIFLLVVYGLLEAGRAVFMYSSVVTASREAARYASAYGNNSAGYPHYQDCIAIRQAARNVGFLLNLSTTTTNDITIRYDIALPNPPGGTQVIYCTRTSTGPQIDILPNTGDTVTVTVQRRFNPIVRLVPFTSFMMSAKSSRTLTGTIDLNPPTPVGP